MDGIFEDLAFMPEILLKTLFIRGRDIQPAPVDAQIIPLLLQYRLFFRAGFEVTIVDPAAPRLVWRG